MRLNFWLKSFLTLRSLPSRHRARRRRSLSVPALASLRGPLSPVSEPLEDRALLTSVISFLDGTLTIDVGADGEQTTLSVSGGTDLSITSSDAGGTTADAAAQALGFTATTAADEVSTGSLNGGSPVTQIVINGASGTQTIVLGDGTFPALTAGGNSDVELITVTGDVAIDNNDLQLSATQTVALNSGASISTVDGNVTLEANVAGMTNVDAVGISLNNATISTSGTGDISLTGRGGNGAGGGNQGVDVTSGGTIQSTATGVDAGQIMIVGTGGSGTHNNSGVVIADFGSTLSTVDGAISVTGVGGSGSENANHGVQFIFGATATSTGTGSHAGTITLLGTGGSGTSSNQGVLLHSAGTAVTSIDGDISITGRGGAGSDAANIGVFVFSGASVASTGTTADAATITISGTGGSGMSSNIGVSIHSTDAEVTTVLGDVSITGQGGSGTGNGTHGVQLFDGGTISSTGTGLDAPEISITGTAGSGHQYCYGIYIDADGSAVRAVDGTIQLHGQGDMGTGTHHGGVAIDNGGMIQSSGSGSGAATISVTGTGGIADGNCTGIVLYGQGTLITSVDGDIDLVGEGGEGTGGLNGGVWILDGGHVESTGTTADAATVSIHGTGQGTGGISVGVMVQTAGSAVTSINGDVVVEGAGGPGTTEFNHGVAINNGAVIQSTGADGNAANIQITGTAGTGTQNNFGITLNGTGSAVTSNTGTIQLTGNDTVGGGVLNRGIAMFLGSLIESTGSSASLSAGNFFRVDALSQINSALGTTINVDLDSNDSTVGADVYIEGTLASAVQTTITTGDAADSVLLNLAADSDAVVINTGDDNDTVDVSGSGVPVTINGGGGDDSLTGSAFDDVLNGEDGNDTLIGLGGLDQLTGGAGTDSFENVERPLVVDTALDVDDGDYSTGNLSLREAVRLANESVDLDETISFDAALNGQTITLIGGELPILNPVTIAGPGATLLTIDAANHSRVFNVDDGDLETEIAVSISGLTLTRGMTTGNGGAIVNSETLTVTDLTISSSSAMYGGGIYNDGDLTVIGSTLSGNSAESGGGILDEQATLTVTTSTIADNVATFQGAGIRLGRSNATVIDSAILRNTGPAEGGGIASYQSSLTVENSTLFGNETRGDGGGIFVGSGGAAEVVQSTISGNRSGVDNVGLTLTGGARAPSYELQTLAIKNSVAVNAGTSGSITIRDLRGSAFQGATPTIGGALSVSFVENSNDSSASVSAVTIDSFGNTNIEFELADTSGTSTTTAADLQAALAFHGFAASQIAISDNASVGTFSAMSSVELTGGVDGESVLFQDRRATATEGSFATLGGTLSIDFNAGTGNSIATSATAATDAGGDTVVTVTLGTDGSGQSNATLADVVNAILADQTAGGASEFLLVSGDTTGTTFVQDGGGAQLLMDGYDGLNSSVFFTDVRPDPSVGIIRIDFNNAGADQTLAVNVSTSGDDHDITVTLGTDSSGTITSTAAEVAALINGDATAGSLIHVAVSGDGSEFVADSGGLANGVVTPRTNFIFGGGIRKRSGSLTIHNSIIAGNFRGEGTLADDVTGTVNTGTFNLVGDADSSGGLMDGVDGNIVGDQGVGVLDLSGVLEPLPADHGGPAVTFALPEGSLAIDAGDNAQTPSVNDQRGPGFDRIVDGDGDLTATVDLGSFEFLAAPPPGPATVTLTVPASLELLVQDELLILRDIQGTEFFRQLESSVTELQINLSDGPDLLRFINADAPVITPVKVDAGGGNDQVDATLALARVTLVGGSGDDLLTGGAFADVLSGGAGSDTLDGSTGNDFLRGQGGGGDVLVASPGNDKLDGGAGIDLVVQTASGNSQLYNNRISGIGYSEIISIEMAILNGSDDNDSISAEQFSGLVTINGAGGNDRLYGAASGDVINGGDGNDFIVGFAGDDRIDGGNGNDNLVGGAGSDTLIGGDGDDQLRGLGSSGDVLSGGPGADRLDGGKGNDRLVEFGDAGFILTDTLLDDGTSVDELADLESVFLTGGNGGQRLDASGFSGWVKMIGGQGDDTLIGTELGDILFGLGGDDVIEGRAGNDRLRGSAGRDRLSGGVGDDELLGQGSSGDTLRGGDGTDTLDGGAGVDRIFDDGVDVIAVDARDNVLPA